MLPTAQSSNEPASKRVRFGTTQWSMVLKAGQGAEEALLRLCRIYWRPLYAFIRWRGHHLHEAEDLTQSFFAHLLEHHALEKVGPAKGRFRSFLLVSAQHFLDNEWHKAHAIKRGGKEVIVSWESLKPHEREGLAPRDGMTPEKAFNRRWALMLLERVMERLRTECAAGRKADLFDRLRDHLSGEPAEKTYQQLAAELNTTEGAIKVTVHRLRRRFGELVREQIAQTVDGPAEIDEEIRELFAALS